MRFSAVFDPQPPVRASQDEERAPQAQRQPEPAAEPPQDLDERVRQTGEWQLEDW